MHVCMECVCGRNEFSNFEIYYNKYARHGLTLNELRNHQFLCQTMVLIVIRVLTVTYFIK